MKFRKAIVIAGIRKCSAPIRKDVKISLQILADNRETGRERV